MENSDECINDICSAFQTSEESGELDFSSCDIEIFPSKVFQLSVDHLTIVTLDHNNIQTLPAEIKTLFNLTELSAIGNELVELPNEITELSKLEKLVINGNCLSSLPNQFGNLKSLLQLSVIDNKLQSLPTSFTMLSSLEELYLDENCIVLLPCGWCNMVSLTIFEISNNQLVSLPIDIGDCNYLEILNLNTNKIGCLPSSFSKLVNLLILDLSNNKIEELPEEFGSSHVIEKLYLENNGIKFVPQWFRHLYKIKELIMSDNSLHCEPFDDSFCNNSNMLKKLEAGANFMTSLSKDFGNLDKLEVIHFGSTISELERSNFQNGNWLKELPQSFCLLKNLKRANINENQIAQLPVKIGELQQLSWLDLGQNMLEYLPDSFCDLVNLTFLQLSKNLLKELPGNIGDLKNLIDLRLDDNLLRSIPDSIGNIRGLVSLDLFHNKLTELPSIVKKLKNLKRLDLDQNEFALNLSNIPKITPGNSYPERDPTLKDNWRGKTRPDKMQASAIIDIQGEVVDGEEEEIEEPWNEQALRMAVKRGMSMWRSHTGADTREATIRKKSIEEPVTERFDDDEWIAMTYNIPIKTMNKNKKKNDPTEEDWDEEIEQETQYNSILDTYDQRKFQYSNIINDFQNSINRYPPAHQAYSGTAQYESFVYKNSLATSAYTSQKTKFVVADGQFDDVE